MPSDTDDGTQLHNNADNLESSISKEEDEAEDEKEEEDDEGEDEEENDEDEPDKQGEQDDDDNQSCEKEGPHPITIPVQDQEEEDDKRASDESIGEEVEKDTDENEVQQEWKVGKRGRRRKKSEKDNQGAEYVGVRTRSLSPSVTEYVIENGRSYHAFQRGKYPFPNDLYGGLPKINNRMVGLALRSLPWYTH